MAFRASKSTSKSPRSKKTKPTATATDGSADATAMKKASGAKTPDVFVGEVQKPEEESLQSGSTTADDFVAAPATETSEEAKASPGLRSTSGDPRSRPRFDAPRSGYPNRGYGNYRRGNFGTSRFGRDRFGNDAGGRSGYFRDRSPLGSGGSFRSGDDTGSPRFGGEAGYRRRDWSSSGDSPHTQDINVPTETVRGILDLMGEGHGFLRPKFTPSERDVYISQSQIRRFLLRNGDMVEGQARQPKDNERYWGLLKVEKINDQPAEDMTSRPRFDDLTAIYPDRLLKLEFGQTPLSVRIIDLVAPIGFGQRALIVSPPKAGKTTILKELAAGVSANYPDVHLMAALIGERPEEVTDLTRSIKGEVLASNFDQSPQEQTRVAEVTLDRAKRLVEMGKDVVVLLDSITRLARAYNMVVNPSGRTLSGGFDPAALYPAKKFLGAARCVEPVIARTPSASEGDAAISGGKSDNTTEIASPSERSRKDKDIGGSLTVIGTALVDTGSRMDDLIYEEFKGTGNMELTLSRSLQERRVFPAIDVGKSGTRHDELLLGAEKMKKVVTLRNMLSLLSDEERTMMLVDKLGKTKSNDEFLDSLGVG